MNEQVDDKADRLQYKFLLVLSTAYLATDINVQGVMGLMPFVREDFDISRAQAGLYTTAFFLFATVVAIFSGRIVDKIGSRRGLVIGTIVLGALMVLHSQAPYFSIVLILAFFSGLFFSIITPSLSKAVMTRVSPENRATSMGIIHTGGGVGGFLGASFLPLLGGLWGWRTAVVFSGLTAVAVGLFLYFFLEEDRQESSGLKGDDDLSFGEAVLTLLKNKYLLLVCSLGFALGAASGSVPAHYTLYLTQDIGISAALAGFGLGALQIGGIAGRTGWGWISDNLLDGSRGRGLAIAGFFLAALSLLYSFYITTFQLPLPVIYAVSFFLGFATMGWMGLFFTAVAELASEELTGTGTGLALIFVRSGVVLSPPVFGYLADMTGNYRVSWLAAGLFVLVFTAGFVFFARRLGGSETVSGLW
ncbi:MAG: MFS transporter [Halanaerobiaceae bacterium]